MANGVDPDQTPRSAASDLGLHCLFRPVHIHRDNAVFMVYNTPPLYTNTASWVSLGHTLH